MQSVVRGLKISVLEELALKLAKFENEKRAIFQTIVERGGKIVYQDDDSVFFTERKNLVGDFAMTNTKTAPEDERMALAFLLARRAKDGYPEIKEWSEFGVAVQNEALWMISKARELLAPADVVLEPLTKDELLAVWRNWISTGYGDIELARMAAAAQCAKLTRRPSSTVPLILFLPRKPLPLGRGRSAASSLLFHVPFDYFERSPTARNGAVRRGPEMFSPELLGHFG